MEIMEYGVRYQQWLNDSQMEPELRQELEAIKNDDKEIYERFYQDLTFGTGGLRGIMGAGTNRMNIYTVGAATQGLSNYLKKEFADLEQIKVVIGHDCRNNSRKFAEISADIFSANGIKVYLFDSGNVIRYPKTGMPERYHLDGFSQSERIQRIQGLLG